jgi:hypothetical protein
MRLRTVLLVCAVCSASSALADPRTDILSAAARCNAIGDYRIWLECYYGAAQPLRAMLGLPPAAASQVALVPPAYASRGLSAAPAAPVAARSPQTPSEDEDYAPRQPMTAYSFDGEGWFTVTLANGSVWRQVKEDSIKARWKAPAQSYIASVVPGMFGSHLMRVSDKHSYRVSPVR